MQLLMHGTQLGCGWHEIWKVMPKPAAYQARVVVHRTEYNYYDNGALL
jgi:hypothetical protein